MSGPTSLGGVLHAVPEEGGIAGLSILLLAAFRDTRSNRFNVWILHPACP